MYKVRIERIVDGESFGESEAIPVSDISAYLTVLSKPSMFGGGAFRFVLVPA